MKTRQALVSNSSTSSFLLIGVEITPEKVVEYVTDDTYNGIDIDKLNNDVGIRIMILDDWRDEDCLVLWTGSPCYDEYEKYFIGYPLGDIDHHYSPRFNKKSEKELYEVFQKMTRTMPNVKFLTHETTPHLHCWKLRS